MAKIYITSNFENTFREDVAKFFREQGHDVYDFIVDTTNINPDLEHEEYTGDNK